MNPFNVIFMLQARNNIRIQFSNSPVGRILLYMQVANDLPVRDV